MSIEHLDLISKQYKQISVFEGNKLKVNEEIKKYFSILRNDDIFKMFQYNKLNIKVIKINNFNLYIKHLVITSSIVTLIYLIISFQFRGKKKLLKKI